MKKIGIVLLMALLLAITVNTAYATYTMVPLNNSVNSSTIVLNLSGESFAELNMSNVTFCWRDLNPTGDWHIIGSEVNGTGSMDSVQMAFVTSLLNDTFVIVDGIGNLKAVVFNGSGGGGASPCTATSAQNVTFDLTQQLALNNTAMTASCTVPQDNTAYGTNGSFQVDCRLSEETNATTQIKIGTQTYTLTENTTKSGYVRSFNVLTNIAEGTYSYSFTSSDIATGGDVEVEGTFMVDERTSRGGATALPALLDQGEQGQTNIGTLILIIVGIFIAAKVFGKK